MGYYCEDNEYQKKFLKNNLFKIIVRCMKLAVTGNKAFYKKLFKKKSTAQILTEKINEYQTVEKGDLLSICVLPEYRGKGIAQSLLQSFTYQLKKQARKICFLTVNSQNQRAINFYEKNHFEVCRKTKELITYAKEL